MAKPGGNHQRWDVGNMGTAQPMGNTYLHTYTTHDLAYVGNHLFTTCNDSNTVFAIDLADPSAGEIVSQTTINAPFKIMMHGELGVVASGYTSGPSHYYSVKALDFYDAFNEDADADGLDFWEETWLHGTDPKNADTDGDGYSDSWEIINGYDPLSDASPGEMPPADDDDDGDDGPTDDDDDGPTDDDDGPNPPTDGMSDLVGMLTDFFTSPVGMGVGGAAALGMIVLGLLKGRKKGPKLVSGGGGSGGGTDFFDGIDFDSVF
jgi:hypothetical protein